MCVPHKKWVKWVKIDVVEHDVAFAKLSVSVTLPHASGPHLLDFLMGSTY